MLILAPHAFRLRSLVSQSSGFSSSTPVRAAQIPAAWQALCFGLIPFGEAIAKVEEVGMDVCALVLPQRGLLYGGKWATAGFEAGGWLRCRYLVNSNVQQERT